MITPSSAPYDPVAKEYYDPTAHPTCASFRAASFEILSKYLLHNSLVGVSACDLGGGKSVLAEFFQNLEARPRKIEVVDQCSEMLRHSSTFSADWIHLTNAPACDLDKLGRTYDVITAFLADPFNEIESWSAAIKALNDTGRLFFVTPSWQWTSTFRSANCEEREKSARFILKSGDEVFVPSIVYPESKQQDMFNSIGFNLIQKYYVTKKELEAVDPKLGCLADNTPVLVGYSLRRREA